MSAVQVPCPSCGAAVLFPVGTGAVAVCSYCRSVVARGDRKVEDLGKVAAIVETGAVLKLGLAGHLGGLKFQLVGRTQMRHAAGGVWDEWYAAFSDGRWGWLAEAQGRFYLTFAVTPKEGAVLPLFEDLQPEQQLYLPGTGEGMTINETGTAMIAGAEGEIPWRVTPGTQYSYADLTGEHGAFATLDYSEDPPVVFVGRQMSLDELGIPKTVHRETWEQRRVAGRSLSCPNCGGALAIRAPDKTERIGCPHCGSLLDASQGDLRFLSKPEQLKRKLKPALELGAEGRFGDDARTVIGMLRRSVTFDGVDYFWDEYLLYHPRDGFEWLTQSDGHWNRVRNVPAGDVHRYRGSAAYDGRTFRKFQQANATVRAVLGECYWKVAIGEVVKATDYICPPQMLSRESTQSISAQEVNWSLGEYVTPREVQAVFDLKEPLPRPLGVGPNEPFRHTGVYYLAAAFIAIVCLIAAVQATRTRTVYETTFNLAPPPGQKTQVFFSDKFELGRMANVCVRVDAPNLINGMLLEGDLVREGDEGHFHPFVLDMGYYSGVDDGEAWSEGSKSDEAFVSSPGKGTYTLRLEAEPDDVSSSGPLHVKIQQHVVRAWTLILVLLAVTAIPAIVFIYQIYFVTQRWKDSEFSPYRGIAQLASVDDD